MEQQKLNERLAITLAGLKIKHVNLIALGNSIAAGYSFARTTKPLLLRNKSIGYDFEKEGIDVDLYHFARPQNNNEEHVLGYIEDNISEADMSVMNRADYNGGPNSMPVNGVTQADIEEWFPVEVENPKRIRDLIFEKAEDSASIILFAGATGSFLDNLTRDGSKLGNYGIYRDLTSTEAILKKIQHSNRVQETNAQVYVTGVPNFLGLNFAFGINKKLKELAQKYANVVYVEPIKSKFIYQTAGDKHLVANNEWSGFLKLFGKFNLPQMDIHYDEEEYDQLNNSFLSAIDDNYLIQMALIDIDRELYKLSIENELSTEPKDYHQELDVLISKWLDVLAKNKININLFKTKLQNYLKLRYPHDFYYLDKAFILEKTR